jgi:hypothetical protein
MGGAICGTATDRRYVDQYFRYFLRDPGLPGPLLMIDHIILSHPRRIPAPWTPASWTRVIDDM